MVAVAQDSRPTLDRSTPPSPGESRPFELPSLRELTLANGLNVVLVERRGFPTLSARLSVRAGYDAAPGNLAVAELTARLLRDGTESLTTPEEVAAFIARHGIRYNASVGHNRLMLSGDALSNKATELVTLLADLARSPRLDAERLSARRDEYVGELQLAAAQPSFHRDRLAYRVLFGDHLYGRLYPAIESVESVTQAAVLQFHAATYLPGRARLVLVGDIPDGIDTLLDETLGRWTGEGESYAPPAPPTVGTCNEAHVVLRPDSAQTSIQWVGPGVLGDDADHFPALVANQIFGGGPSARLFMNLREDKSYTYGAYSRTAELLGAAYVRVSSDVRSDVTGPALTEFLAEFSRVADEAFSDDEMRDSMNYLSGVFPIQLERNSQLASRLSGLLDLGRGADYLQQYRGAVAGVTTDQAVAAGRRLIARGALTLVMVGEEAVVVDAARAVSSQVHVYNLEGTRLRSEPGSVASNCP
jgi:predicted Zn-dependent peptidase